MLLPLKQLQVIATTATSTEAGAAINLSAASTKDSIERSNNSNRSNSNNNDRYGHPLGDRRLWGGGDGNAHMRTLAPSAREKHVFLLRIHHTSSTPGAHREHKIEHSSTPEHTSNTPELQHKFEHSSRPEHTSSTKCDEQRNKKEKKTISSRHPGKTLSYTTLSHLHRHTPLGPLFPIACALKSFHFSISNNRSTAAIATVLQES